MSDNREHKNRRLRMDMTVRLTCPECGDWNLLSNDSEIILYGFGDTFEMTPKKEIPECKCKKEVSNER